MQPREAIGTHYLQIVDHAFKTCHKRLPIKIYKQPQSLVCKLEISEQLTSIERIIFFGGLELYDDLVFNNNISTESTFNRIAFIYEWNLNLTTCVYSPELQFLQQRIAVSVLKQARTKIAMHLYSSTYYIITQGINTILIHTYI